MKQRTKSKDIKERQTRTFTYFSMNMLSNETKTPHTYSQNNSEAPKFLKDMVISWFFT